MIYDALSIVANRVVSVGSTIKDIPDNTHIDKQSDMLRVGERLQDVRVDLSPESLNASEMVLGPDAGDIASKDFDSFLVGVHLQLAKRGKDAGLVKAMPQDDRPERVVMAKQAANYLLSAYYSSEAAFSDVSSNNPFSELDRLSLSNMAFDNAENFTSAERQLAFYEISRRDTDYRNKTYDLQEGLRKKDDSIAWGEITSYLRDAQLTMDMSEAEKAWRGWGSTESLKNRALMLAGDKDISQLKLPSYADSDFSDSDSLASGDESGSLSEGERFRGVSVAAESDVLKFIFAATEGDGLKEVSLKNTGINKNSWLVIYSKINSFSQE